MKNVLIGRSQPEFTMLLSRLRARRMPRLLAASLLIPALSSLAQPSYDEQVRAYIDAYKGIVIQDMRTCGIPASIKLAQAILESGAGQSLLATQANNHFGIKCHPEWTGRTFTMDDDEPGECFRKYDNAVESFRDHSLFLTSRERYRFLFSIDVQDYRAWAYGLRSAGYATNPNYPELLISIIERYDLGRYDLHERDVAAVITTKADMNLLEAYRPLFTYFAPGPSGRSVYLNNHVQCTFALENDDLLKIARDFGLTASLLVEYNDLVRAGGLARDQVVYLQKKKTKAIQKQHVVGNNQTMWEISQVYAIRLANLYRKNLIPEGYEPVAGKVLRLR